MIAVKIKVPSFEIDEDFANFQDEFIKNINKQLAYQYHEGFKAGFYYAKNHDKIIEKIQNEKN